MSISGSTPAINEALHQELVELARPHIDKSDGLLSALEYDPEQYEWQAYDQYVVPGEVAHINVLDLIGNTVVKGFVEMSDELMTESRRRQVGNVLENGQSLYVATSHSNLIDPAIGLAAVTNPLRRDRSVANNFQNGIIINKMIGVLKYQVGEQWMPCVQVLKWLCDRTYLSFPQSKTFRDSGAAKILPKDHIPAHNGMIKQEIDEWLAEGGVALGVAPSGSTHKEKIHGWSRRPKLVLPEFTEGTSRMMAHPHIRVLSLIMEIGEDAEERFIEPVSDNMYHVKRWQGAHRIPRDMANAFNVRQTSNSEAGTHQYQARPSWRDLPGLQKFYVTQEAV